jgi:hypothetical protein
MTPFTTGIDSVLQSIWEEFSRVCDENSLFCEQMDMINPINKIAGISMNHGVQAEPEVNIILIAIRRDIDTMINVISLSSR